MVGQNGAQGGVVHGISAHSIRHKARMLFRKVLMMEFPTREEMEMYLMFCGWTTEFVMGDKWLIPPQWSPILKIYAMTCIISRAFKWQKVVDNGGRISRFTLDN